RPLYALISDLKQRGLLDDTLVVWSGEFGRTSMNEERNGSKFLGRDHHPHCYTIWMAGGGIKKGFSYGQTDELGYFIAENKTSVRDLQSTILHLTGFEARKFKFPYQGLDQRLIGPADEDHLIKDILA
ncbi:MAG TPA: sulfatase, partial [Planctomycetaceae bacterium]|nr:sulfatase [Planctomycetaceae bacterium]